MQEVSHHGHLIKAYREQAGLTQGVRIPDVKVRRTLAWALHIPHELLGLSALVLPPSALRSPLHPPPEIGGKNLSRVVYETLRENLRMRLDLYYLGSALGADQKLNDHIEHLTGLAQHSSLKDRRFLLELLSHNYQLKGMIARDQIDYVTADACFTQASLVAQEAECPELHALSLARQATAELWQNRPDTATHLYEIATDIAKRAPAALRTYLAAAHAETQGTLGDERCLASLTVAHTMLKRIDPDDDELLLFHSTRSSEQSLHDGWLNCHTLLGKPGLAIEKYDQLLEHKLDLSMTRMEARLSMQYAEALFAAKDMSCCFYAVEGVKLARAVGSRRLFQRANELASKLVVRAPHDERVKKLIQALHQ